MIDYEATIAMLKAKADQRVSDISSMEKEYKRLLAIKESGEVEGLALTATQKPKIVNRIAGIEAKIEKAAGADVVSVVEPVAEEM
uniref:Uncharacterized protein n=1 Tax=viral metagenome TaxID=1070528 RepID=A0A6H1ZGS1_9ZZZZ